MERHLRWIALPLSVGLCLCVGGLGAIATTPEIQGWYRTLQRPAITPPDWVFGPVWTTLYILMGIAAWLVWQRKGARNAIVPLAVFGGQLGLNLIWSILFFKMHQIGWAAVEIVFLWLAIGATCVLFFRQSRWAGSLLLPYLGWVSFAAVLNFEFWRYNSP